ncbi:hypothetical protein ACG7TL_002629 [Trametes sanguinea]
MSVQFLGALRVWYRIFLASANNYSRHNSPTSPYHTHSKLMMRPVKVYEHPEFKAEPEDITLLSTICFVLALLSVAAIFILGVTCLVFWDDCGTCELH